MASAGRVGDLAIPLGVWAAYRKNTWVDRIATVGGFANVPSAFPSLILALAIVTFAGPSLFHVTIAIGILSIAPLARVVRANTIGYARREFVQAAQVCEVGDGHFAACHFPVVEPMTPAPSRTAVALP